MPIKRDCGDREVSLNLVVGISYRLVATSEEEQDERDALIGKVMELKSSLEKTVLNQICDHIGLDDDEVANRIYVRDTENAKNREVEEQGRAEKSAKRAGLPAPPPGKLGPNIAPGESAFEKDKDSSAD